MRYGCYGMYLEGSVVEIEVKILKIIWGRRECKMWYCFEDVGDEGEGERSREKFKIFYFLDLNK